MYNNIGNKIKGLAKAIFIIETIAAIGTAIFFVGEDIDMLFPALLIAVIGPLVAYVSTWLLYGLGEIIVKLTEIEKNTRNNVPQKEMVSSSKKASDSDVVTEDNIETLCNILNKQ